MILHYTVPYVRCICAKGFSFFQPVNERTLFSLLVLLLNYLSMDAEIVIIFEQAVSIKQQVLVYLQYTTLDTNEYCC